MLKKFGFILLLTAVTACGFEPLYVEKKHTNRWYFDGDFDTSITQEMAAIKIEPISDRFGQMIRNNLIDLLTPNGMPEKPKYRLFVSLTGKTTSDQALRSDITATRKMVRYTVSYYMTKDAERLVQGSSLAYASYDILANPYSTTMAQKKGDADAARIIADDIALRLGAYFHSITTKRGNPNEI